MEKLSHTDKSGNINMVDVSDKAKTERIAIASGQVLLSKEAFLQIETHSIAKGSVLTVAKIAGIQGAKKTSELIPLCHPIFLSKIDIELFMDEKTHSVKILATAKTNDVTGVEMEALTAVSISALSIYDMCKAVDKSIRITEIQLEKKEGGKSGSYARKR